MGIAIAWLATIAGLGVALVGFGITLHQISKVKTAAQAAENAIKDLKLRFSHFDAIQECAGAELVLGDLRSTPRDDSDTLVRLSDGLARSLINIAERLPDLDSATAKSLQTSIQRAGAIARSREQSTDDEKTENAKYFANLREIHRTLVKIRALIEREQ